MLDRLPTSHLLVLRVIGQLTAFGTAVCAARSHRRAKLAPVRAGTAIGSTLARQVRTWDSQAFTWRHDKQSATIVHVTCGRWFSAFKDCRWDRRRLLDDAAGSGSDTKCVCRACCTCRIQV